MAIEVFNRYENKYMIDEVTYKMLLEHFSEYLDKDVYNQKGHPYKISNIYYDTVDHQLIKNSLAKPKYKEKLRLRAYGVPNPDTKIYVEIKKKVNGIVNKRRTSVKANEAYDFMIKENQRKAQDDMNPQVIKEIDYMIKRYDLFPSMYISYDRIAYFSKTTQDLRISFDSNICYRIDNLNFEAGIHGKPLVNSGYYLMEIKAAHNMPLWLSQILTHYNIYPTSFSKYGNAYNKEHQLILKNARGYETLIFDKIA
ncbi:polyphosphate polymerase domain-containing protein [Fusibacter sp. 3D3]|uniref:polyphosphate polymerase domain-containing protein n=1 Tax=Fusibacter sp. 3D3 TaxID=1048380 RepID=UPI0008536201|nr:polyphosphate polymerase domain-containing protein [Fusibacter sp. 3D3]GAU79077.1 hypothetical protein F3D3_3715 [Fusibacter sp. 3D3]